MRRRARHFNNNTAMVQPQANTFIGGVASTIPDASTLASILNISLSDITAFQLSGNDVLARIEINYSLPDALNDSFYWRANNNLTYYKDEDGKITSIGQNVFRYSNNINQLYFPNATHAGVGAFIRNGSYDVVYIPRAITLGTITPGDENVLNGVSSTTSIYLDPSLQTANAGSEEGDVAAARSKGANIVYVQNFTAPNTISDLSTGTIYGTAVQLNFTAPTGNTNAINHYEVYVNGLYKAKIQPGGYCTGLNLDTTYTFEVKPVDIYNNKSTSNIISQKTNATYTIQSANVISYYKMEGNVLDSKGTNNGTATAITYASGLVGQTGVFNGSNSQVKITSLDFDFFGTDNFTFGAVFNLNALPNSGQHFGITAIQESSTNNTYDKSIRINSNGSIDFYVFDGATKTATSNAVEITINTDYVVFGTYDGTNIKIYVNGVLKATAAASGSFNFSNPALVISHISTNGVNPAKAVNGKVDEIPVFNIALTDGEVAEATAKLQSGQSLI